MGSISFINKASSGGSIKPNIFIQETEPETKEGIWVKANKKLDKVIIEKNRFYPGDLKYSGTNSSGIAFKQIPYQFYYGSVAAVGTNVFLFGGASSRTSNYKYDLQANTFESKTSIPIRFNSSSVVAISTDIYIIGSAYNGADFYKLYKYDTLTDTYTQLSDMPISASAQNQAVAIGTDIYLYDTYQKLYKYDTLLDSYEEVGELPYLYRAKAVAIGTDIYLISDNKLYKYDTITNTYVENTLPAGFPTNLVAGALLAIDTNIYILGGGDSNNISKYKFVYKYDTVKNTCVELSDMPNNFGAGAGVVIDNVIYLFGGNSTKSVVQSYKETENMYTENNALILYEEEDKYSTQLFTSDLFSDRVLYNFNDVAYHTIESGIDSTLPTYYGTGTEWVKFKN